MHRWRDSRRLKTLFSATVSLRALNCGGQMRKPLSLMKRLVCLKVQQHCIERKKRTMRKWSGLVPFFVQLGTRPHLCSISEGAF